MTKTYLAWYMAQFESYFFPCLPAWNHSLEERLLRVIWAHNTLIRRPVLCVESQVLTCMSSCIYLYCCSFVSLKSLCGCDMSCSWCTNLCPRRQFQTRAVHFSMSLHSFDTTSVYFVCMFISNEYSYSLVSHVCFCLSIEFSVSLHLYISVSLYLYLCTSAFSASLYLCVSYLFLSLYFVSLYLYLHVYPSVSLSYICLSVSLCLYIFIFVSLYLLCLCISLYLLYLCICICTLYCLYLDSVSSLCISTSVSLFLYLCMFVSHL